ncbi:hypothetical protein [Xenorhabdus bharatensis]|uniref:hypothetical protein n=1 Tax=Xenorhabdus bharatensis TaxID=3136256 RepID=UPI0030F47FD3
MSKSDIKLQEGQSLDFPNYYTESCSVISSDYIMGVHIMFMGKQGDLPNENHENFLLAVCYAFNKVAPRVKDFSKKVREIKVYLEEDRGCIQTRWPKIEDKATNQSLKWSETGPCLHINRQHIEKENLTKNTNTFLCFNLTNKREASGKSGPRGIADMMYDKMKSSHKSPLGPVLAIKVVASIVHEIGHILHAQSDKSESNLFWESKRSNSINSQSKEIREKHIIHAKIAENVSSYVQGNNSTEFVAEVFTGLIYGKKYNDEVLMHYKYYNGPELIGFILPDLPANWLPMRLRKE